MLSQLINNAVGLFSPKSAFAREAWQQHRQALKAQAADHQMMRKMMGASRGGYEASNGDRLKGYLIGSPRENDIPQSQIDRLRFRSWNLYRNNPQARKVCRTLKAKVIGRGLSPQPQTKTPDGKPFVEYRTRAREIWDEFAKESDYRGKPSAGGQNFVGQCDTALQANLLSGGALFRLHRLSRDEQKALGLFVPLQVQLLHVDRLDTAKTGDKIFRGVQHDDAGRIEGFWILKSGGGDSTFVPIADMRHLHTTEDIDQMLTAPWMAAALLTADDRRGVEYSEVVASEMASCVVATYKLGLGQEQLGLGNPNDSPCELTDSAGNPVTSLSAGMVINKGQDGEFDIINPNRPNNSLEGFLNHLVRSEAVSMPGVKASTLTGDYRNSSFSSERSADNDIWPELEKLQDWFAVGFCQPIYEEVITAAVLAGLFKDVNGFTAADFEARKREYLRTNWQGPVSRSINPKDDAEASRERVRNANSSPQREAGKLGADWREILHEQKEFIEYAGELGLPEDIWQQALGIDQTDAKAGAAGAGAGPTEQQQDDAFNRMKNGFSLTNCA